MIYIIDTAAWLPEDVKLRCEKLGIEFKPGFFFRQTCIRLASLMLKHEIAKEYGVSFDTLTTGKHGKPEFVNSPVHFNISHHEAMAIAVTSTSQPVGIDITSSSTPFTTEQMAELYTQAPPPNLDGVFWAVREAFLKFTGEGTREGPLKIQRPAHSALPNLLEMGPLAVMPLIRVENQYARLFKLKNCVGAVIALKFDLETVHMFSNEKEPE